MLSMEATQRLLAEYGIPLLGVLMKDGSAIDATLATLGGENFAMKAISKDVVHKSDAGAVRINLKGKEDVARAWEEMYQSINAMHPGAVLEGMLIQHMKEGTEVIIGMKRDATFGPVILFGMGGIFAEAMKDTALGIAPVTEEEAVKMVRSIKGARLLQGMRGKEPVSEKALVDVIVNLSRLAIEHPEIVAIDLNPVMASSTQAAIVDARFMVGK
jgi:acetyltransferase